MVQNSIFFIIYVQLYSIYVQSHLICIQSHLIYFQSHLICIQSDLKYIQSHLICIQSHLISTQSYLICIQSHIICSQSHLICIQSHLIYIQLHFIGQCRRQLNFGFTVSFTLEYQPEDNGAFSLVTCHVFYLLCLSHMDIMECCIMIKFSTLIKFELKRLSQKLS